MKRILLPAIVFFALTVPMQSASADEKICKSSTSGLVTQKCLNHLQKIKDIGDDLSECMKGLNDEYLGNTGFGAGKWNRYIKKQNECITLSQKAMDALTDAYVPGGDTSVRRQLRKGIKEMKARVARAEADMKKASE